MYVIRSLAFLAAAAATPLRPDVSTLALEREAKCCLCVTIEADAGGAPGGPCKVETEQVKRSMLGVIKSGAKCDAACEEVGKVYAKKAVARVLVLEQINRYFEYDTAEQEKHVEAERGKVEGQLKSDKQGTEETERLYTALLKGDQDAFKHRGMCQSWLAETDMCE